MPVLARGKLHIELLGYEFPGVSNARVRGEAEEGDQNAFPQQERTAANNRPIILHPVRRRNPSPSGAARRRAEAPVRAFLQVARGIRTRTFRQWGAAVVCGNVKNVRHRDLTRCELGR